MESSREQYWTHQLVDQGRAVRAGMPVVVGAMAKGVLSEDHPYFAGALDMAGHRVIWDLLAASDLIVTAGFYAVDLITPTAA